MSTFGNRVTMLRMRQDLTRLQLAKKAGITTTTLRNIETDASAPHRGTVARLANALDVDADWLKTGLGEPLDHGGNAIPEQDPVSATVGDRIAQRRKELLMTRRDLVAASGVSETTIKRLEKNTHHSPSRYVVARLAHALEVEPAWLLGTPAGEEDIPRDAKQIARIKLLLLQERLGLPTSEIARRTGISDVTLTLCMTGKRGLGQKVQAGLCNTFELPPDYFRKP